MLEKNRGGGGEKDVPEEADEAGAQLYGRGLETVGKSKVAFIA